MEQEDGEDSGPCEDCGKSLCEGHSIDSEEERIHLQQLLVKDHLERMAQGTILGPEDLPEDVRSEFFSTIATKQFQREALQEAAPWWTLAPFGNHSAPAAPAPTDNSSAADGFVHQESRALLTFNGRETEHYFWAQDREECVVAVKAPAHVTAKAVRVYLQPRRLLVTVGGRALLSGKLAYFVKVDEEEEDGGSESWELAHYRGWRVVKVTLRKSRRGLSNPHQNQTKTALTWHRVLLSEHAAPPALHPHIPSLSAAAVRFRLPHGTPPIPAPVPPLPTPSQDPTPLWLGCLDVTFCYCLLFRLYHCAVWADPVAFGLQLAQLSPCLLAPAGGFEAGSVAESLRGSMQSAHLNLRGLAPDTHAATTQALGDVELVFSSPDAPLHALQGVLSALEATMLRIRKANPLPPTRQSPPPPAPAAVSAALCSAEGRLAAIDDSEVDEDPAVASALALPAAHARTALLLSCYTAWEGAWREGALLEVRRMREYEEGVALLSSSHVKAGEAAAALAEAREAAARREFAEREHRRKQEERATRGRAARKRRRMRAAGWGRKAPPSSPSADALSEVARWGGGGADNRAELDWEEEKRLEVGSYVPPTLTA